VSGAALAYEILLMRLFSIIQWHHFAYMIISLTLLGYGASGTFLALGWRRRWMRFRFAYPLHLTLFGVTAILCLAVAQRIPFNPQELLWDPGQWLNLLLVYLLLVLPFFFAANGIGLAIARYTEQIGRIYAADLMGAGIGSIGVVLLLFGVFPDAALRIIALLGIGAAALGCLALRLKPRKWLVPLLVAAGLPLLLPHSWTDPVISPYKGLSQTLRIPGTRIVEQRSSPLGLISIVASPVTPLRHAPGLSLNAASEPPPQLGLFTDADGMTVITHWQGNRSKLAYLDMMTSALPYYLHPAGDVLILGAGPGTEVLQARYHHARSIDAVELNPQIVQLIEGSYADFAGKIYQDEHTRVHIKDARGFLAGSTRHYDLIQMALLDSFGASSAGLYALNENYLYTVEALQTYLRHLTPGGYLAMTRWIRMPPRDNLKLFATAVAALKHSGHDHPERQLALIRGWQTGTLVVKNGTFTKTEIAALKQFCLERSFDAAYYPGIEATEVNRFNRMQQPYFYEAARALLAGSRAADFLQQYKFNLQPATDDRPYFSHFFKWEALAEILALRGQGGMSLLESGYLVLITTLAQAILASIILILLPLWFIRKRAGQSRQAVSRWRVFVYFMALGLAFLFIEIAFIQKFILFLHHPLYALTVVLSALLIFSGLGSAWSQRLQAILGNHWTLSGAVLGLTVISLVYFALLGPLFQASMGLPDLARIAIAIVLIAPVGFFMGIPFPLALSVLGRQAPALIPWAWGINGCASVVSTILATLFAIQFGFTALVLLALALYGVATLSFPERRKEKNRRQEA
jgi:spermidine synthase